MAILKKNVTLVELLYCFSSSLVLSLLIWQKLDFRALGIFAILVGIVEVATQMRYRLSITCPHCGFDPVLYLRDKNLTAQRIKTHIENRKTNPLVLLSKNPTLNLPKRKPEPKVGENLNVSS